MLPYFILKEVGEGYTMTVSTPYNMAKSENMGKTYTVSS